MSINAVSPLDGRYQEQTAEIAVYFSEAALIRFRVQVEVEWLIVLAQSAHLPEVRDFTIEETALLRALVSEFSKASLSRLSQTSSPLSSVAPCLYL